MVQQNRIASGGEKPPLGRQPSNSNSTTPSTLGARTLAPPPMRSPSSASSTSSSYIKKAPPPPPASAAAATSAPPPPYSPSTNAATKPAFGAAAAAAAVKKAPPPPPPLKPKPKAVDYVVALYDFEAQADGDLDFKAGDRIEIVEKSDSQEDWWTGKLNGKQGVFPGQFGPCIDVVHVY